MQRDSKVAELYPNGVRVLVTGGRYYPDRQAVFWALDLMHRDLTIVELAHGATHTRQGADWHADAWCRDRGVSVKRYPVLTTHDGPWPRAGCNRNIRMRDDFGPDWVVVFPGGNGTKHMKNAALEREIPIWEPME